MSTPSLSTTIDHLLVGRAEPFGPNGEPSAIRKNIVSTPLLTTRLGLAGDEQADKRVHGGEEKAIHHFPAEHYDNLKTLLPDLSTGIGSFGENLSSLGITEKDVCIGDVFSLGSSVLQLSQGRQPCWKLNVRFQHKQMAKTIQEHGWTGWYYRVLTEGEISSGSELTLIERPYPEANLERIQHFLHREPMNLDGMKALLAIPVLPTSWRKTFEKRVSSGLKESNASRLETPKRPTEK